MRVDIHSLVDPAMVLAIRLGITWQTFDRHRDGG